MQERPLHVDFPNMSGKGTISIGGETFHVYIGSLQTETRMVNDPRDMRNSSVRKIQITLIEV